MATVEAPLGFPRCRDCYWLRAGSSDVCFKCASQVLAKKKGPACGTCSQRLQADGTCKNFTCGWDDLRIGTVSSIAPYTDPLAAVIKRFKYEGQTGWGLIFGRLVHGWLNQNLTPGDVDLIVPNPTFSDPGTPVRRHTEAVIEAAAQDDLLHRWPFDAAPWAMAKHHATAKSASARWKDKYNAAREHATSLTIDSSRVRGKRVLLFDDICTTLNQQEFVARRLISAGAVVVNGLVLARGEY
jgi:predicted amidophosphoribosyltransferase